MKQTNNAIKFLMAQYRAIFQNAYFKGLATAAVVTMGLAAGQAQADRKTDPFTGAESINGNTVTITGADVSDSSANPDHYKYIQITTDDKTVQKDIKIIGGEAEDSKNKIAGTNITFTGANLSISGNAAGLLVSGGANATATAIFNEVTINEGTLKLAGNATSGTGTVEAKKIILSGAATNDANLVLGANTVLGYDLTDKGAAAEKPAAGQPFDLANYTNLDLAKNGKLAVAAAATTGGAVVNAGKLSITCLLYTSPSPRD